MVNSAAAAWDTSLILSQIRELPRWQQSATFKNIRRRLANARESHNSPAQRLVQGTVWNGVVHWNGVRSTDLCKLCSFKAWKASEEPAVPFITGLVDPDECRPWLNVLHL